MKPRAFSLAVCLLLALGIAPIAAAQTPDLDPRIQKLLSEISEARLASLLQVSFDTYQIGSQGRITRDVELRNVMAVLPGKSPRRLYVSGHYDSLARAVPPPPSSGSGAAGGQAQRPGAAAAGGPGRPSAQAATGASEAGPLDNFAPGANDDGSGTALTMELARVFAQSGIEFDATLVFITLAGEEQGLIGAHAHAQKAKTDGLVIDAVFNNDMVGNVTGGSGIADAETVRVFAEGPEDSSSRQLARFIRRQAARYLPSHQVWLVARHDRFGRGGDHAAFNWQHEVTIGNVTEYVLPNVSINDYVFGVAAIGPGGHESVVVAYVNSPRADTTVKLR